MPFDKTIANPTGSLDWSGGVDSVKVPTIQGPQNPNGLQANQLAWLDNATIRDGGITPRGGYTRLAGLFGPTSLFQGGFLYDPLNDNPYLILSISGNTYKVVPGPPVTITQLNNASTGMPASQPYFFYVQAEQFLVIQAGDNVTLPLIWDGTTLRRSKGITNTAVAPGTPGVNEIPAATAMDYYLGRLWYLIGRNLNAGDIVQGPSGTAAYRFNDAVLNVTENPLVVGGDGFTLPTQAGNGRAVFHNANLNSQLGQGTLFVGTRTAVYAFNVPVTRTDWIAASNTNQPLMTVVQLVNGPVNDRSVVPVNGDVYYKSLEPGIRSLLSSLRYWNQPGNIEISKQENRVLQFENRALSRFSTGIQFGNRLLESSLPKQLSQGVIHQAILPFDFIPMSSFGGQLQPVWEGMYEGLQVLQMYTGDYGGLQRAFAVTVSQLDSTIELWELTEFQQFDNNRFDQSARITWYAEFPSFTWGNSFALKKLVTSELWVDRVFGTVNFKLEYRPDGETCWLPWHMWKICSAKNTCEDVHNPVCYPITPYGEGYRSTMTLPVPPPQCETANKRPGNIGYQFQAKLTVTGFCRIRGLLLYAEAVDRMLYAGMVCSTAFEVCPPTANTEGLPSGPTTVSLGDLSSSSGSIGTAFSGTIMASGGNGSYTFTVTSGSLPPGLSASFNPTTMTISGTPVSPGGSYSFTLKATDSLGNSTTRTYSISIKTWAIQDFANVTTTLTGGGTCVASAEPAWNGVFNYLTTATAGPEWYFQNQSYKGFSVDVNNEPLFPSGNWQDNGTFTQLFFFVDHWTLWIVCNSGDEFWAGNLAVNNPNNPAGVYVRTEGDSALPATITIA